MLKILDVYDFCCKFFNERLNIQYLQLNSHLVIMRIIVNRIFTILYIHHYLMILNFCWSHQILRSRLILPVCFEVPFELVVWEIYFVRFSFASNVSLLPSESILFAYLDTPRNIIFQWNEHLVHHSPTLKHFIKRHFLHRFLVVVVMTQLSLFRQRKRSWNWFST